VGRYKRLLGYLNPYWGVFGTSLAAAVVASVLDGFTFALLIPFLRVLFEVGSAFADAPTAVERVIDFAAGRFVGQGDQSAALRNIVVVILVAVALKNVAGYVATYLATYIKEGVTRDLRREFYAHIQKLGLAFFQRTKGGQLISRMLADTEQANLFISQGLQAVLRNGVLILVYLAILFALSWRLTLITLLLAPAIALVLKPIILRVRELFGNVAHERGELTAIMTETVSGARLVKAHAAEPYELRRFTDVLQRYFKKMLRTQRLAILASPLSETLGAGVFVLLLLVGSWATLQGQSMRPEVFVAFVAVAMRLLPPVKLLAQFPSFAEMALAGASRVFEVLDRPPDDVDPPGSAEFSAVERNVVFKDVWFSYRDGEWVLRGIDLTVRCGEVVAIVGQSGAGKSTLVDLLPRFIDPQRGAVLLDGVPTTAYSRRSLRHSLGVVSQETVIFNDTVLANIAYGEQAGADRDAVVSAARAANAHGFISRLPQGYDTVLGERGTQLSGGERQRIAIARALLRDPPILILDEATSALDAESERLVREAIDRLLENRTVLVIAHRLSTVARADAIAVLDGGRIVELGRHDELVTGGGFYQKLYEVELAAGF
jgi:subfamily B ATP-binding cassette protein MsbA